MKTTNNVGASSVETITPEIARKYLSSMVSNRTLSIDRVKTYARAMQCKQWPLGDPIKFLDDGRLYDGQHRLQAVIMANCPVEMIVIRNMPLEACYVADRGKSRTLYNVAQLRESDLNHTKISVINSLTFYEKVRMVRRTDAEMFDLYEKYKDGIDFSIKGPKVKGSYLRLAIFFAVICKAYYYEKDLDRLRHFMHVCYTGENAKPEDNAALHLKTVFTHAKVKKEPIDKTEWTKKILSSLQSFMKYEPRSKLHEISYDPYPLPDFSDMKNEENRKAVLKKFIKERMTIRELPKASQLYFELTISPADRTRP